MTTVAQSRLFVIGVDTTPVPTLTRCSPPTASIWIQRPSPDTRACRARAIAWAGRRTSGDPGALWVVEGIGSYAAQLARQAGHAGYRAIEAARMGCTGRRGIGKSDRSTPGASPRPFSPRRRAAAHSPDGRRNPGAAQILLTTRDELTGERTIRMTALTALIRITHLGIDARGPLGARKITEISRWRPRGGPRNRNRPPEAIRRAKRILVLDSEITDNMNRIAQLVDASPAAGLLEETGIGPVTAATALAAWSHPGRVRGEAAPKQAAAGPMAGRSRSGHVGSVTTCPRRN